MKKLLEYLKWSHTLMSSLVMKLNDDQINLKFDENAGSIKDRLVHLAEEIMAWLFDLQELSWKEEVEKIGSLGNKELLDYSSEYIDKWILFASENEGRIFDIKENEIELKMSIDELVFNVVNHSTYHRGQIITLLRRFDIKPEITDYFWFRISNMG